MTFCALKPGVLAVKEKLSEYCTYATGPKKPMMLFEAVSNKYCSFISTIIR